jgi:predicted CopG family antitoxin
MESKVIKINLELYNHMLKMGKFVEVLEEIVYYYDLRAVSIGQDYLYSMKDGYLIINPSKTPGEFEVWIENETIPVNIGGPTRPVRIPLKIYNDLLHYKAHPEESFSFLIFKMFEYYKYTINHTID